MSVEVYDFRSDNVGGVAPELLEALLAANRGTAAPYGDDDCTHAMTARFRQAFEHDGLAAFPLATGTGANAVALAILANPYGAIYCHETAHILLEECGAPEFFTGGAELIGLPGAGGKLAPDLLAKAIVATGAVVSLTQATEWGTVYTPDEVRALASLAHAHGLAVHMDGARFANAVAALDADPKEFTWKLGIDVLSLGGSKNGLGFGDAVVFFDRQLADGFDRRCKQAGHLIANSHYISAGWVKYLADDLWKNNARHANAMAQALAAQLRKIPDVPILYPVEANSVFIRLDPDVLSRLNELGWALYAFFGGEAVRLTCSWATTHDAISKFIRDLQTALRK